MVLAAEQGGDEVDEELLQLYCTCLLSPAASPFRAGEGGGHCSSGWGSGGQQSSEQEEAGREEKEAEPEEVQEESLEGGFPESTGALPPGWGRKLWFYSPAAEPPAAALPRLTDLERASLRRRHTVGDATHGLMVLQVSHNLLEGGTGCHEWCAPTPCPTPLPAPSWQPLLADPAVAHGCSGTQALVTFCGGWCCSTGAAAGRLASSWQSLS